jgi:phosphatidylglycerophosphate synthase
MIVGGTLFLFVTGRDFKISPSIAGKLTTFFQLSFIFWIFACYFFGWNPIKTYSFLIIVLALFSFISLFHYVMIGFRYLFSK